MVIHNLDLHRPLVRRYHAIDWPLTRSTLCIWTLPTQLRFITAVRFQADADLSEIIVAAALRRSPEIDFGTAHAGGLGASTDFELLEGAAREDRILVTHDSRTMPTHFAEFVGS